MLVEHTTAAMIVHPQHPLDSSPTWGFLKALVQKIVSNTWQTQNKDTQKVGCRERWALREWITSCL